jgi:hypothetical protein
MVVTAGAMAVGGGLLTVVSLRVVESVTMVSAHTGVAAKTADTMAHLPRLVILFSIFFSWIGFANLLLVFLSWEYQMYLIQILDIKCWY